MMKNRYATVDLGTNTFHLLVVERGEEQFLKEIYRERHFVKLAEEGIETIGKKPFQRGLETLIYFHKKAQELNVDEFKLFGTAALRTASNGQEFIQQVIDKTGQKIELISGDEEARLIHQGVRLAVPFGKKKGMILDIGGGSVEIIIADNNQVYWAQSFPVGVAVLFKLFHKNDPITLPEINAINAYLKEQLQPFLTVLKEHKLHQLIGASGAFEVAEIMLPQYRRDALHSVIPVKKFLPLYHEMMPTTLEERLLMEDLPNQRADLIVVAYLIIHFVLERTGIQEMAISKYAVKEGVLKEMIN